MLAPLEPEWRALELGVESPDARPAVRRYPLRPLLAGDLGGDRCLERFRWSREHLGHGRRCVFGALSDHALAAGHQREGKRDGNTGRIQSACCDQTRSAQGRGCDEGGVRRRHTDWVRGRHGCWRARERTPMTRAKLSASVMPRSRSYRRWRNLFTLHHASSVYRCGNSLTLHST